VHLKLLTVKAGKLYSTVCECVKQRNSDIGRQCLTLRVGMNINIDADTSSILSIYDKRG
jgi:hypothetical protein